jgi:hypothetical protein
MLFGRGGIGGNNMEKLNSNTAMRQAQTAIRKYWYVAPLLILLALLCNYSGRFLTEFTG